MHRVAVSGWIVGVLAIGIGALCFAQTDDDKAADTKWEKFRGAWFEITFPPGFNAVPSMKSRTSDKGCDSVFFRSPDGKVEFYVFSPQWNGEPRDIEVKPDKETTTSAKLSRSGDKRIREVDVRATDGSYERTFLDTEDTVLNTRLVFGIRYSDEKALKDHHSDYRKFKESLAQFGD